MGKHKKRIEAILQVLNKGIYEREEILSVVLLSALSGQNIFLYGPPGTAKSLISRRLAKVFDTKKYFEYLMQKFSTPEEVFGPISLTELKKDNYHRKTESYLPTAEFAFLDEIWKSSPAILNTLLTLLNEKKFKNGKELIDVPLKVVVSASNEIPPSGQGLEALYDRFITRIYVPPMQSKENFELLLQNSDSNDSVNIDKSLIITDEEWQKWKEEIKNVKISQEVFNIIHSIRLAFEKESKKKGFNIYVSDRRWKQALTLVKAGAFFCDRKETNIVDALLLSHTLWTSDENREKVNEIVENVVRESGFDTEISLINIDEEKEDLEKEINEELYYTKDIYATVKLARKEYFKVIKRVKIGDNWNSRQEDLEFYIPKNMMKKQDEFHPIDKEGNELQYLKCDFKNQGSCKIQYNDEGRRNSRYLSGNYWEKVSPFSPKVLFHKGDRKENINERLVESLQKATSDLELKIKQLINEVKAKQEQFLQNLDTPFVTKSKVNIAIESITKQIEELELKLKDTQRLSSMVG